MADLSLTAAFGDYDRIAPLRDGTVRSPGQISFHVRACSNN